MIRRIEIFDFMAHKNTVLDLGPGVTLLTGPNNTGKSAVVEAIRSLCENPPSKEVIRHGARKAIVRIELDTGDIIEWERTPASALYRVFAADDTDSEPAVYAKLGRGKLPDDIRALLLMDPIGGENRAIDVHIGNQRYPIFLLDQSGARAADFFASSTEAEYLLQMQQTLKDRTREANQRRKYLAARIERAEKELGQYADLDRTDRHLRSAEALYSSIEELRRSLPLFEESIQAMAATQTRHEVSTKNSAILATLRPEPVLHDTPDLEALSINIRGTERQLATCSFQVQTLGSTKPPPPLAPNTDLEILAEDLERSLAVFQKLSSEQEALNQATEPVALNETGALEQLCRSYEGMRSRLESSRATEQLLRQTVEPSQAHDTQSLEQLLASLLHLSHRQSSCNARSSALDALPSFPEPMDLSDLSETHRQLVMHGQQFEHLERIGSSLSALEICPEPAATDPLQELVDTCENLSIRHRQTLEQLRQIDLDLSSAKQEIQTAIEQAGICPLCRQPLDLDHFLDSDHETD